jgi:catechol 2,3-dioxygenase-like lactoylglutathione lyase family enzyme
MSQTEVRAETTATSGVGRADMKLEVVTVPVSDVDRAKRFYAGLGWRLDADFGSRGVQFTPPGSGCSIQFGEGLVPADPGSTQGLHLIVSDIEATHAELVASGVDASGVFHCEQGYGCRYPGHDGRVDGRAPDGGTYGSFVTFSDPDGNGWILQEVTARFPGRVAGDTAYSSANDLAEALRRAAAAHGEHEERTGEADANWPDWYADYMVRERAGQELPL